jgi:hypothetical protein
MSLTCGISGNEEQIPNWLSDKQKFVAKALLKFGFEHLGTVEEYLFFMDRNHSVDAGEWVLYQGGDDIGAVIQEEYFGLSFEDLDPNDEDDEGEVLGEWTSEDSIDLFDEAEKLINDAEKAWEEMHPPNHIQLFLEYK